MALQHDNILLPDYNDSLLAYNAALPANFISWVNDLVSKPDDFR